MFLQRQIQGALEKKLYASAKRGGLAQALKTTSGNFIYF
jgi:hypothetical protein